jgi:hypothetical protein
MTSVWDTHYFILLLNQVHARFGRVCQTGRSFWDQTSTSPNIPFMMYSVPLLRNLARKSHQYTSCAKGAGLSQRGLRLLILQIWTDRLSLLIRTGLFVHEVSGEISRIKDQIDGTLSWCLYLDSNRASRCDTFPYALWYFEWEFASLKASINQPCADNELFFS